MDGSASNVGRLSLALDPSGNPHIAYFDETADDLLYASKSGGVWTLSSVQSAGDVGRFASLALDERGHSHIAYQNLTNTDRGLPEASMARSRSVLFEAAKPPYSIRPWCASRGSDRR